MKRTTTRLLFGALTALAAASVGRAQATSTSTAKVESGELQGVVEDGVVAFKGVPFAAPPVGDLRWRPPQPAAKWTGVRDATEFSADCMQGRFGGPPPGAGGRAGAPPPQGAAPTPTPAPPAPAGHRPRTAST